MGENRPEELAELESRARWTLEHPEQLEPRQTVDHAHVVLRLWKHSSFSDYSSWSVLRPTGRNVDNQALAVRKVVWERATDLRRFNDPMEWLKQGYHAPPTIIVRDAAMLATPIDAMLAEVALVPVPVAGIAARMGLDGETFGFEQKESGFWGVRLEWWADGPEEWRAFTNDVARMRAAFEQCFSGGQQDAE